MNKPAWDMTKRGETQMAEWLDAVLDQELDAAFSESNSDENVALFLRETEPLEGLIERLRQGLASFNDQKRAAHFLEGLNSPVPRKRGPKPKPKIERAQILTMAAQDATRIKEIWRRHYGLTNAEKAVEFACKRWIIREEYGQHEYDCKVAELTDKVHDTLRRTATRNFGA